MADKGLEIALKLKAQIENSFGGKFNRVLSSLKDVSESAEKLAEKSDSIKKFEKNLEALQKTGKELGVAKLKLKEIDEELAKSTTKSNTLTKAYDNMSKKLNQIDKVKNKARYNKELDNLKKLEKVMNRAVKATKKLENEHRKSSMVVDKLGGKVANQKKSFNKYRMALEKLKVPLKNYREELKKTEIEISKLNLKQKLIEKIKLTKSKTGAMIGVVGNKIAGGIKKGAIAGTAIATAGLGFSIKNYIDFEKQMRRVEAISGATKSQFEQLKNKAIELGGSTVFTSQQVAEGMEKFALAGFKTNEILDVMPGVLRLTAASGEDLAMVADIISDNLVPFKMGAKDVERFADVLANTMTRTNVNIEMLGESLKYVGGAAGTLGLSLEDTTAALGLMGDQAIKSGQAGRNLKSAFSHLANSDIQKKLKAQGIDILNSKKEFIGLIPLIEKLEKKTKSMTGIKKLGFLKNTFGEEGALAISKLLDAEKEFQGVKLNGSKALAAMIKENENSNGKAKQMEQTMLQGAQGAAILLSSAIDSLKIVVGEIFFSPFILKGMKKVTEFISELANVLKGNYTNNSLNKTLKDIFSWTHNLFVRLSLAVEPLKKALIDMFPDNFGKGFKRTLDSITSTLVFLVKVASNIIARLLSLIKGIGKAISFIGIDNILMFVGVFKAFKIGVSVITTMKTGFIGLISIIKTVGGLTSVLKIGMLALGNPMTWIIAALVTLGYIIYKNWDIVKAFCSTVWEGFKKICSVIWEVIVSIAKIGLAISPIAIPVNMLIGLVKVFRDNWDSSKSVIDNLKNGFIALFEKIESKIELVKEKFSKLAEKIKNLPGIRYFTSNDKVEAFNTGMNDLAKPVINGSHRNGLDYVPYDGYIAELHKGERVLTADENKGSYLARMDEFSNSSKEKTTNQREIVINISPTYNINSSVSEEQKSILKENNIDLAKEIRRVLKELGINNARTEF